MCQPILVTSVVEEVKAKILQRLGSLSSDDDVTKMASDGGVASGTDGAVSDSKSTKPRCVEDWLLLITLIEFVCVCERVCLSCHEGFSYQAVHFQGLIHNIQMNMISVICLKFLICKGSCSLQV